MHSACQLGQLSQHVLFGQGFVLPAILIAILQLVNHMTPCVPFRPDLIVHTLRRQIHGAQRRIVQQRRHASLESALLQLIAQKVDRTIHHEEVVTNASQCKSTLVASGTSDANIKYHMYIHIICISLTSSSRTHPRSGLPIR